MAAAEITAERAAAGRKLEKLAEAHINDLAMKARFAVQVTAQEAEQHWTRQGWDLVDCRIATNAGEPLKPLEQIASGGELSRVMLALKVSVEEGAYKGQGSGRRKAIVPRTLVFDEIDIGIGGRAAEAVGQKLKELSSATPGAGKVLWRNPPAPDCRLCRPAFPGGKAGASGKDEDSRPPASKTRSEPRKWPAC